MSSRETQSLIIQTAIKLFNDSGSASSSIGKIAVACGISKGNLHYHFKNKQEIIREVYNIIVKEMDESWYEDGRNPTVTHMAEMFARHFDLVWRFRFFYREMVSLMMDDNELRKHVLENRKKRTESVINFFRIMISTGAMKEFRSEQSLRYLVETTWIFCDNWLNYIDLQGDEEQNDIAQTGYDYIIEILLPYLSDKARDDIYPSYDAINAFKSEG